MHHSPEISVIIPLHNEEAVLQELIERTQSAVLKITENFEIILVNDGSQDRTLEMIQRFASSEDRLKYLSFSRNFGHQTAVTAGIQNCQGNTAVIIDGDLQDPPEVIPEMYQKYREGFEVVYVKRRSRKGDTFFKKSSAKFFYRLLKKLTNFDIPVDTGDFRLIDRKIIDYLCQMPEQNKFIRGQVAWIGFRQAFVEYDRDERRAGSSGYPFSKMLSFALDGITAFSNRPLKAVTYLGFIVASLAFLIIIYALLSHFVLGQTINGWTSLIISSMFIGGIQLLSLGIIGEYISRINANVRNRPLYIVEKTNIPDKNQKPVS